MGVWSLLLLQGRGACLGTGSGVPEPCRGGEAEAAAEDSQGARPPSAEPLQTARVRASFLSSAEIPAGVTLALGLPHLVLTVLLQRGLLSPGQS